MKNISEITWRNSATAALLMKNNAELSDSVRLGIKCEACPG
jgi:hypothetical protein